MKSSPKHWEKRVKNEVILCACGNRATVFYLADWCCERCERLDREYHKINYTEKLTCGKPERALQYGELPNYD